MKTLKNKSAVHQYGSTLSLFGMVLDGDINAEDMKSQGNHGLGEITTKGRCFATRNILSLIKTPA